MTGSADPPGSIRHFYADWTQYRARLVDGVRDLSPSQLALSAGPDHAPIWALAAHCAGIKTVLIPKANKKDLKDIPKKIRSQLRIIPVEFVDDVLREALVLEKPEEFGRRAESSKTSDQAGAPSAPA